MSEQISSPDNQCRILVADDNVDAATSLGMLLEIMGHTVLVVHDGVAAVEQTAAFRPEVMLLDIGMPNLDGYATCARIRAEYPDLNILILALTGWTGEDMRQRSLLAGFDHYLIKPFDVTQLEALLKTSLPRSANATN